MGTISLFCRIPGGLQNLRSMYWNLASIQLQFYINLHGFMVSFLFSLCAMGMVEHFQDGDEVVFPSLWLFFFFLIIRFGVSVYSIVQRVNKCPLICFCPASFHQESCWIVRPQHCSTVCKHISPLKCWGRRWLINLRLFLQNWRNKKEVFCNYLILKLFSCVRDFAVRMVSPTFT